MVLEAEVAAHLQELHVVLGERKILQRAIGLPELRHLPLHLLQQFLGLTDGRLLLEPDQLLGLDALLLSRADQLGEDPLALLSHRFRRVLQSSPRAETPSATRDEGKEKK